MHLKHCWYWYLWIYWIRLCHTAGTAFQTTYGYAPQIPVAAVFKVHVFFTILFFTILFLRILIITTVIHVPAQPPQCPLSMWSQAAALVILQI